MHIYPDRCGILTGGMGHRLLPEDGPLQAGDPVTPEQVDAWARHDVAKCEAAINGAVRVPLTQNQFDALVSLAFNIGVGGFLASTVLADLNAGRLDDERRAFELWDKDVRGGVKLVDEELLGRRDREVALFMTPDVSA